MRTKTWVMDEAEVLRRKIRPSLIWVGTLSRSRTGEWVGWYLRIGRKVRALFVRDLP